MLSPNPPSKLLNLGWSWGPCYRWISNIVYLTEAKLEPMDCG